MSARRIRAYGALMAALSLYAITVAGVTLTPTTKTSIGIFYQPGAPEVTSLWQPGDPGQRLKLEEANVGSDGEKILFGLVEIVLR